MKGFGARKGSELVNDVCGHKNRKHRCKGMCEACYSAHRRSLNPLMASEAAKRWRQRHPGKQSEMDRKRRKADPEKRKAAARKSTRIAAGILDATGEHRHGQPCDICGKPMLPSNLDHNHKTGSVRGWLCRTCNKGLGLFGDSTDTLIKAALYLLLHACAKYDAGGRLVPWEGS